jgi:phospholipase C
LAGAANGNEALSNLEGVKHIVVLMKENRSFDQMLGYLMRDGLADVDGLTGEESNADPDGEVHKVFEWGPDQTVFHPPQDHTGKIFDPCHGPECVAEQLADGNGGFVKNFVSTRKDKAGNPVTLDPEYRALPMGYYTAQHLPVYDHLARNYCVCDAWHSSIPGDTWPNRLYSLTGRQGEKIGYKRNLLGQLLAAIKGLPGVGGLHNAPIYDVPAFTRQLADRQWRWYSQDPATLRAADGFYRSIRHLNRENFTYFDRTRLVWNEKLAGAVLDTHDSFLDDAAKGELPDVSWIDPNFADLHVLHPNSNDDHPPADVKAGQALVLDVYEALRNSPVWEDTILVVVYDEHGGFYDHVVPPPAPPGSEYPTFGVRVPALVVGPRVKQFVSHETFEHTSLIATILRRFAANPEQAISRMPARVQGAPHLGGLLQAEPRTDLPAVEPLREEIDAWRTATRRSRRPDNGKSSDPEGAGHPVELHDFQEEFLKFALAMRDKGLPPGQP